MNLNWLLIPTLALALVLFVVGKNAVRLCQRPRSKLTLITLCFLLGIPGFLFPLYYLHWFDNAKWFYELRALPYSERMAAGAGLFVGTSAELLKRQRFISQSFLFALLILGIAAPHLKPLLAPIPRHRFSEHWRDDVGIQGTPSSCGAASAATVFKALGSSGALQEEDIARECLTYLGGTENWYIARAFRRRGYTVNYRITDGFPPDLRAPAIAGVRVADMGHFIAIIEHNDGFYTTGDPLVGRREVSDDQMNAEYNFTGFDMEIR